MTARPDSSKHSSLTPIERIERAIYFIRGERVMFDRDLAKLYGVSTKVFNQAVKRHRERFPPDFMFQLTKEEADEWWLAVSANRLRSQTVTLKTLTPMPKPPSRNQPGTAPDCAEAAR